MCLLLWLCSLTFYFFQHNVFFHMYVNLKHLVTTYYHKNYYPRWGGSLVAECLCSIPNTEKQQENCFILLFYFWVRVSCSSGLSSSLLYSWGWSSCFNFPSAGIACICHHKGYISSWRLNAELHACQANPLPSEQQPSFWTQYFRVKSKKSSCRFWSPS